MLSGLILNLLPQGSGVEHFLNPRIVGQVVMPRIQIHPVRMQVVCRAEIRSGNAVADRTCLSIYISDLSAVSVVDRSLALVRGCPTPVVGRTGGLCAGPWSSTRRVILIIGKQIDITHGDLGF